MKEKEEDEERNDNICRQTDTQSSKQSLIQKLRHTLILCGSSGERANTDHHTTIYLHLLIICMKVPDEKTACKID